MKKNAKAPVEARPAATAKAEPAEHLPPRAEKSPIVVGVGGSAGGLEALQQFLHFMPPDSGLAFIHVQHLDPQHKSMMAELLQTSTLMKVVEAADGAAIEPDHVYIGPPDRDVEIDHGRLRVVRPPEPHHAHLAIDSFFRSLAREQGDRAIAVVLSGTGTDGTLGVRAVKGAGGMTIAQAPETAKFDGMPRSAIGTQLVDFVVPVKEIPRVLLDYVRHPYVVTTEAAATTAAGMVQQIYHLLRTHTGHDFSRYKQNTIRRRIERRMAVHQIKHLEEYLRYLHRVPAEVDALFKDLLIGVTNFFRDEEAFHALEERVVPRLVQASAHTGQVRIWVPGCSTGEEAYSIAMLLAEHLEDLRQTRKTTVFATDIDPSAIDYARSAVYPAAIAADVSAVRLDRFFTREDGSYRIAKRIRETVIFALQDVLKDPPFSKIDLISCRNLLIYLEPDLQRKLMQLFHAVLNPGGHLFLGASETVGDASDLFGQVDKKWKIYEKKPVPTHPFVGVTSLHSLNEASVLAARAQDHAVEPSPAPDVGELTTRALLESYAPAAVLVDERYDIVFLHGRTARYLELPTGEPRLNILRMAREELLHELRTALHRATKERAEIVREGVALTGDGGARLVRLRVRPLHGVKPGQQLLLVAFEEMSPPAGDPKDAPPGPPVDPRITELERQLTSMKESLQSTVEEVETSNEEARSTTEELQSANEELQSTNEELETSKEELQSVNEELMTVNNELQKKLEELSQANNDLTNLLNSTEIGTIFLDNDLRIKRYTPAVTKLINLIPTDVGRPIVDIVTQLADDGLADRAREVLRTLAFQEGEVRTKDDRWFLRRILPYRTNENVIDGVVVTFVNVTEVREARRVAEAMLAFANAVMSSVRQPVVLLNKEGRVVQVNQAFYALFQTPREATLGARLYDLDGGRWGALEARLDAVLAGGPPLQGHAIEMDLPRVGKRLLRVNATRTAFGTRAVAGEDEVTVLSVEDGAGGKG